jgi:two-component system, OmpR family, phosphate regulon sensor histidine kinase PhoR
VYTNESESFQKETNTLLHMMVFAMDDSLLLKGVKPLRGDTSIRYFSSGQPDTFRLHQREHSYELKNSIAQVQVVILSGGHDSLQRYLKPLITKIRNGPHQRNFTIRLSPDSLPLAEVQRKFSKVLKSAGIDVPFSINKIKVEHPFPQGQIIVKEDVIYTPSGGYQLVFQNLKSLLLKKIAPQIAFSVFVTLLTMASFLLLYRSLRSQLQLMEIKNDFISNVTHELKTPITTVGVAIEALKNFKGIDNPKLTEDYLNIAQNELNRLSLLTDNILKTSLFEGKGVVFKSETLELDKLLEQVLASLRPVAEKANATIEFEKQGTDFHLKGGVDHLTSVVYNLIDNALKYSPIHPLIKITLKDNKDNILLIIRDHGPGIAKEYQKKIFEKFFRVPTGDIHNSKGYGLGLSYVQTVIKNHGGTIDVESELGKGSCFIIMLPKQSEVQK